MKALSLWQPWASLWCSPVKMHETRHWPTSHRGWLAVHATKKFVRDVDADLEAILDSEFGGHWGMDLPTGCIIGAVDLVQCWRTEDRQPVDDDDRTCGDWSPGRHAFERQRYFVLPRPMPCRGQQGKMWPLPPEISKELEWLAAAQQVDGAGLCPECEAG